MTTSTGKTFLSIGSVIQHKPLNDSEILFECQNGIAFISYIHPDIFKLRISKQNDVENFSYALKEDITKQKLNVDLLNDTSLLIKGEKASLMVEFAPVFKVKLLNAKQEILVEDDDNLGYGWLGDQVFHHRKLQNNEVFFGLGEKTEHLNRAGRAYTNWNTDHFGYKDGSDPLYASIPFFLGLHNQRCYGLFYDNTHRTIFNFGASNNRFSYFQAEDGDLICYFIAGNTPEEISCAYAQLTGAIQLPPKWALGLQQCRYSYYPDSEVETLAHNFRVRKIPCDVIYLDIHYMDSYKVFTFHPQRFPNPKKLSDNLSEKGFKMVTILDPGVKVEPNYHAYEDGLKEKVFANFPDGTPWTAQVWPGWCHFPDFTNPKGREWWAAHLKVMVDAGINGFWTDMNEPATWGQMVPPVVEFNMEGNKTSFLEAHNAYGMQMARATFEGSLSHSPNKRPFILTRSGYSGVQRYAAVWTGDNQATSAHMLLGVRMMLSMSVSGIPFCAMDIGGFEGTPSQSLYARWVALGAFLPMARIHSMINSRDAEPWALGETVEAIARNYISLRYRLLPYIYSIFDDCARRGMPIMRPLAFINHRDYKAFDWQYEAQYFFGPSLMVCPSPAEDKFTKVHFPEGDCYFNFFTDEKYQGGSEVIVESPDYLLPVFVKEGAIIPMHKTIQHTGESKGDTLYIHLYKTSNKKTIFDLYDDEGEGFGYKEGHFARLKLSLERNIFQMEAQEGTYDMSYKEIAFVLHGYQEIKAVVVNGAIQNVNIEMVQLLQSLPHFDPLGDPQPVPSAHCFTLTVPFTKEALYLEILEN